MANDKFQSLQSTARELRDNLSHVILGKDSVIEYVLVAFFSSGNILLEDVPGVGKTTLAKALAKSVKGEFNRIQFTPDLLPADILGGSIYNPQTGEFFFRSGPIFANIVLADEINRASPRTQSALLEAMTETQVSIEGERHLVTRPFCVIATQNPIEFHGTYPLPEAQLDRFLIRLRLGYPEERIELELLNNQRNSNPLEHIKVVADCRTIVDIQHVVQQVGVEQSIAEYLLAIIRSTRTHPELRLGASPRASLMLYRASQALAFLRNRDFVIPDDTRELAGPVLSHRITLDTKARYSGADSERIIQRIIDSIPVPV